MPMSKALSMKRYITCGDAASKVRMNTSGILTGCCDLFREGFEPPAGN